MNDHPANHVPGTNTRGAVTGGGAVLASLTPLAQRYLDQTRPWVRFMSVVTFASAGLMVVAGLVMLVISVFGGFAAGSEQGTGVLGTAIGGGLLALFYIGLACLYIVPGLYLSRYASAIKRLNVESTAAGLEEALEHQKSFWRFVGILTVIGLVIAVLGLGLALVAGAIAAAMAGRS